jgi:hypothetical protein
VAKSSAFCLLPRSKSLFRGKRMRIEQTTPFFRTRSPVRVLE